MFTYQTLSSCSSWSIHSSCSHHTVSWTPSISQWTNHHTWSWSWFSRHVYLFPWLHDSGQQSANMSVWWHLDRHSTYLHSWYVSINSVATKEICPWNWIINFFLAVDVCSPLIAPANGDVIVTGLTLGSQAMYSCDAGYELVGLTIRECSVDGIWSGREPFCRCKLI